MGDEPLSGGARSLARGAVGTAVRSLQLLLLLEGHSPGAVDGIYGPVTAAALRAAQAALGLPATGAADQETLGALRQGSRARVELPRARTPLERSELVAALRAGHERAVGEVPSEPRAQVAMAQLLVEHGADLHAIWTFNLGNLQAPTEWPRPWFVMTATEIIRGKPTWVKSRWVAAVDPAEGAELYWRRLAERYAGALPFFDAGDPAGAARALKRTGYYTGDAEAYAGLMSELFASL